MEKEENSPRGDFHPLIATEEQPVGGSGLGQRQIPTIIFHSNDYNHVSLQYITKKAIIYIDCGRCYSFLEHKINFHKVLNIKATMLLYLSKKCDCRYHISCFVILPTFIHPILSKYIINYGIIWVQFGYK